MILSKFVRVMDLGWQDFLWGSGCIIFFLGIYTALVMSSAWTGGREDYKRNLPRKYKEQEEKLKDLKTELKTALKERDGFEDRLKAIALSAEVKGE